MWTCLLLAVLLWYYFIFESIGIAPTPIVRGARASTFVPVFCCFVIVLIYLVLVIPYIFLLVGFLGSWTNNIGKFTFFSKPWSSSSWISVSSVSSGIPLETTFKLFCLLIWICNIPYYTDLGFWWLSIYSWKIYLDTFVSVNREFDSNVFCSNRSLQLVLIFLFLMFLSGIFISFFFLTFPCHDWLIWMWRILSQVSLDLLWHCLSPPLTLEFGFGLEFQVLI